MTKDEKIIVQKVVTALKAGPILRANFLYSTRSELENGLMEQYRRFAETLITRLDGISQDDKSAT